MKRAGLAALAVLALAGCGFQQTLTTPSTPLTYRWVMVFDVVSRQTWVQIGPKVDGSGAHVCVQAWDHGLVFYGCYDAVVPGSEHDYRIVPTPGGYVEMFDGRALVTIPLVINNAVNQTAEERTAS